MARVLLVLLMCNLEYDFNIKIILKLDNFAVSPKQTAHPLTRSSKYICFLVNCSVAKSTFVF